MQQSNCPYVRCALSLEARWRGLVLTRGASGERVGHLGFFWPGDVRAHFAANDSAASYARRAVRARWVGAVLTDLGAVLLAAGALQASRDRRSAGAGLALGGAVLLGASVPAQFAADSRLSRAVWWYNARFAR